MLVNDRIKNVHIRVHLRSSLSLASLALLDDLLLDCVGLDDPLLVLDIVVAEVVVVVQLLARQKKSYLIELNVRLLLEGLLQLDDSQRVLDVLDQDIGGQLRAPDGNLERFFKFGGVRKCRVE